LSDNKGVILTLMSLRQKTFLLSALVAGLVLLEFILSALGFGLVLRFFVLIGIAAAGFMLSSQFRDMLRRLEVIRSTINDTARGELTRSIPIKETDEIGNLADAVRHLRRRFFEVNSQMYESLRIESLNILGSILVHDMKNLSFRLRSLSGNIGAHYSDPAFRDSLVRTLDDTTAQMDRMVKRFREQKDTVIVKIRTDLNGIVHSAVQKGRREGAGLRVHEEYGNLPPVWADAMLIESAMLSIIDNARQAMPRGGLLAVRTGVIQSDGNIPPQAVVEIADTGTGMSQEFISKDLFAPFVTTKPRGLGLGLYTCRQIILMHDGEVKVRSELGKGTVFSISLPITD
jgi:signal transduction histidine kinase